MFEHDVTKREEEIIEAMIVVIMRYGLSRTSMNDIAKQSGLSRQSIYLCFSTKDELLRAATRLLCGRAIAEIKQEFEQSDDLAQRLNKIFDAIAVKSFKMIQQSTDPSDILNGFNEAARDELVSASEQYRIAIEEALAPYGEAIVGHQMSLFQLSDYIQQSLMALKHSPKNEAHLHELLSVLRNSTLTLCGVDIAKS